MSVSAAAIIDEYESVRVAVQGWDFPVRCQASGAAGRGREMSRRRTVSRVWGRWRRVICACVVVILAVVDFVVAELAWVGGVGSSRVELRGGFFLAGKVARKRVRTDQDGCVRV